MNRRFRNRFGNRFLDSSMSTGEKHIPQRIVSVTPCGWMYDTYSGSMYRLSNEYMAKVICDNQNKTRILDDAPAIDTLNFELKTLKDMYLSGVRVPKPFGVSVQEFKTPLGPVSYPAIVMKAFYGKLYSKMSPNSEDYLFAYNLREEIIESARKAGFKIDYSLPPDPEMVFDGYSLSIVEFEKFRRKATDQRKWRKNE